MLLLTKLGVMEELDGRDVCAGGVPKDHGHSVYMIQFLYGMAILLPFNIVIACLDFYQERVSTRHC